MTLNSAALSRAIARRSSAFVDVDTDPVCHVSEISDAAKTTAQVTPKLAACIYDVRIALRLEVEPGPGQNEQLLAEGKVAAIVAGPGLGQLGTNIISTSLIAWKAWCATRNPFSASYQLS